METGQTQALGAIDRAAERSAARDAAIVSATGLDPAKLAPPKSEGGVGGPYIPAGIEPTRSRPIRRSRTPSAT